MLTEAEVQRSFIKMFKSARPNPELFEKAEALIEELRPESPLRYRLSCELDELRKLSAAKA